MERESSSTNSTMSMAISSSSKLSSKRLLFDRRYGWVFDEWKDPAEEALAGGRGMFCILPLTKALLKTASQSINLAATSAAKVYERVDHFSPQLLKGRFSDHLHKFTSVIQKPDLSWLTFKGDSPSDMTSCSSHQHIGN